MLPSRFDLPPTPWPEKPMTQDILQGQVLEVLAFTAAAGGRTAKEGREAFSSFLVPRQPKEPGLPSRTPSKMLEGPGEPVPE